MRYMNVMLEVLMQSIKSSEGTERLRDVTEQYDLPDYSPSQVVQS